LALCVLAFGALVVYAQKPNAIDKIEIKEAFEAGFVSVTFTAKENGEKLELKVKKMLSVPLIIVINKGTTTLGGVHEKFSIFTNRETKLDLSRKIEDSVVYYQTGKSRITKESMTMKCSFNEKTAIVLRKIQYSRDQVIEGIISALNDKESWVRRLTAVALGEIGDERAIQPLKDIYEKDPEAEVRHAAEEALEKIQKANL